jgi:hypothetical protein
MASQTQIKNTTIPVTGIITPKGNGGKVSVSKSGSDAGFIITSQNSDGTFLTHAQAVTVFQNSTNAAKINAALTASKSTKTLQGVVTQSAYDQNIKSTPTGTPTSTTNQIPAANAANPKIANNTPGSNTGKVYVFPVDMRYSGAGSQDHIRIMGLKYTAPQGGKTQGDFGSVVTNGLKSKNAGLPPSGYAYEGEVILPIPTAVRDKSSASWSMTKMSPIMAAAVGAVAVPALQAAEGDPMGAIFDFVKKISKSGEFLGKGGADFRQIMAATMSSSFLGSVGLTGLEPSDILARTTGKVSNPNMELLFRGPNMRQFEFAWKFACRSADDAKRIRQIIKFMKLQCLPEVEESNNLINSPNVFFIRYVNGNTRIKSLPQPKICALLDFGIDHTPDGMGWAAYEDSHPVSTSLVMQFAELTPLFRNEMVEAFPEDDDVGY